MGWPVKTGKRPGERKGEEEERGQVMGCVDGEGASPEIQVVYDKAGPVCRREQGLPN